jgi:phosphate-selective porin OprO and OprP
MKGTFMSISSPRVRSAWLPASLVGVLLCSVSTTALAAPADAKLQAMQQQLDDMRAQLEFLRAAGSQDARLSAIQQQLDAMAAQLTDLKSGQDAAVGDIAVLKQAPPGAATTPSLPNGKPAFASADGRFTANVRAIVMMDGGKYFQKNNLGAAVAGRDLSEGVNFRRARLGVDGRLFKDFDYSLIYEFGGSGAEDPGRLYSFSVTYTALKPWRIQIGAYEPNIGLTAAVSTSQMPFLERASPAEVARNVAGGDSRVAFMLAGNDVVGAGDSGLAARWFISTGFTGNTISSISSAGAATAQPFDEQTAWIGRAAIAPFSTTTWQGHLGVNYQYVIHPNDSGPAATPRYVGQLRDRPELRLDGTRLIDTGAIDSRHVSVLGLEAGLSAGPFLIESEWFQYKIDRRLTTPTLLPNPSFKGWYVQGVWVLTGENRPYNPTEARFDAPKQLYNFNPAAGTWGAFELAARYSVVDLNYREGGLATPPVLGAVRGGEQRISTLGLNWYLNPTLRMMLDYQHVDIDRLNASGVQIGQKYNALAARAQLSF